MATTDLAYSDIAERVNQFMAGQANNQYVSNLPNYANMVGSRTNNITQQLSGQLPQDVINQINQQAAERGVANGMTGGQNTNAAYLRALGLNSLQMQQQGSQNLSAAIADTPVSPLFSPASMIVPGLQSNSELTAARIGYNQNRGNTGGVQTAGVAGMPNLNARFATFSPSNIDVQQGLLNSGTFSNGMFTGNGAATDPNALTSNWWNSYGGKDMNSNIDWGGADGSGWGGTGSWDSYDQDAADMFLYDE